MATYHCDMSNAKFFLADNRLAYSYENGERGNAPIGVKYEVCDINNSYEKLGVTIEGSTSMLFDTENGAEIPPACEVTFMGLVVRPYVNRATNRIAYSAKASGIRLAQPPRGKE